LPLEFINDDFDLTDRLEACRRLPAWSQLLPRRKENILR
jgi:hypothetical protein